MTVPFGPADRIVVVSDGLIEQMGRADNESEMDQFGIEGVINALSNAAPDADIISHLFDAIVEHAGSDMLADDATALAVQWVE